MRREDQHTLLFRNAKKGFGIYSKLLKYSYLHVVSSAAPKGKARNLIGDLERISQIPRRSAPRNDNNWIFFRSLNSILKILTLVSIAIILTGCFDLDNSLFNNAPLTSYTLSTAVIPESSRTQIVLSSQGKKIYGYFVRSNGGHPEYCILYNHGNRDHLQFYWDRVELFYQMGFNVFIYDYEGYGMSEGEPGEAAVYSDASAAYNFVRSQGFADSTIAVYGYSLGGAPAIYLSSQVFSPRVLMTESAFASASTLVQSGTLIDIPGSFVMKGEYNNAERIKSVTAPYLIIHGVDDTFIDYTKNALVLYANAHELKKLIPVKGAGHSTVPQTMGEENYISTVRDFVLTKK